ncbi:MAG: flagellin FliC [Gammaproteobacteria bacterium SHHR-1]|uniref:flagellin n=1 Tax=Magnetovirga frankeli TaxID=947516 RepID=UPI001292D943|nr:flagellin FliC [gamma proteobacterium SS-5]
MAMTVNTNSYSLNAQRSLARTQGDLATSMERLSSGLRINRAKDDAAGLAVAQRMEGQARGAAVAQRNIGDGLSYLQVANSALNDIGENLQRMRELAVQSQNGTYTSGDREKMATEFNQLRQEISGAITRATFNGVGVVSGGAKLIYVDGNGNNITISGGGGSTTLGIAATVSISGADGTAATSALTAVSASLNNLATALSSVGAYQSRLEKAMSSAMAIEEAQWSSRGRIMDADFAKETSRMTSAQIVQQAGVSALAQANGIPQLALGLLG